MFGRLYAHGKQVYMNLSFKKHGLLQSCRDRQLTGQHKLGILCISTKSYVSGNIPTRRFFEFKYNKLHKCVEHRIKLKP